MEATHWRLRELSEFLQEVLPVINSADGVDFTKFAQPGWLDLYLMLTTLAAIVSCDADFATLSGQNGTVLAGNWV